VASVFHIGESSGNYYYAMEFVEGESLAALIRDSSCLETDLALGILEQATAISWYNCAPGALYCIDEERIWWRRRRINDVDGCRGVPPQADLCSLWAKCGSSLRLLLRYSLGF
jgi:hypothetical protein